MSLTVLLFYFVLIGFSSVYGTNEGGCEITDIVDTDWQVKILEIYDNQTKQDIFTSTYEGTLDDLVCTSDPTSTPDYFKISKNETHFIVATTEEFDNIDLNTNKTTEMSITPKLACKLKCDVGTSDLNIVIRIYDTNNHPPTFKSLDGEYEVASPIMPMADFSLYGATVVAEDIDFSNQEMTFSIDPDDFSVTTQSSSDSKSYTAIFRARRIIQIDGSKEYTLTATDSGTDPGVQSVSRKFTLVPNPSTSLDTPTFQKNSYSFTYSEKDGKCTLSPKNGNITVTTNKPDGIDEFLTLSGDLGDHFKPTFDKTTKTVTISCLTPVSTTSSISILSLSVKTDSVSSVPVVLYLNEEADNRPEFSSPSYSADYDSINGKVNLNQDIVVTPNTATLEISDSVVAEYKEYFSLKKDADKYEVVVSKPLPKNVLDSQRSIVLTISASLNDLTSHATLVINLPAVVQSSPAQFDSVLYEGTYKVDNGIVDFTSGPIGIVDTDAEDRDIFVEISESSPYITYFSASCKNKVVTIEKLKDLPEDILKTNSFIALTLEVSVSGTESKSSAVLNIVISYNESEDTSYVNFENIFYEGTYASNNGSITVNNEINIDTDQVDNIEVSIINEYNKYFTATYSEKKVTITLTASDPPEAFKSLAFIPLVLQGTIKSTSHKTQAVLNLNVIDGTTGDTSYVNFENILYEGTYVTKDGSITVNNEINIDTDQVDNIEVSITNEYNKYFTATYSEKKVTITLTASNPPEAFKSLAFIPLVLQGTIKSTSHKTQAVLNLRVIDGTTGDTSYVNFENILYEGTYVTKDNSITVNNEINIDTDQVDNIEVSITNEYNKYFTATYSEKKVTITLTASNPPEAFKSLAFIPLVLQGTIKSTSHKTQAVLNLRVIDGTTGDTSYVNFENILYEGTYVTKDSSITVNNEINIDTDQVDNIEVSITNEYNKYFTATYSEKKVTITLTASDPPEAFKSLAFIPLVLQGTIKSTSHKTQAVLNLRVIDGTTGDTSYVNFENILYEGTYVTKDGSITVNNEINIDTDQVDNIEVSITNEYDKYFTATYSEKKVTITLTASDPPEAFKSLAFIPLVLQGTIKSTSHKTQAVLNLRVIDGTTGDTSYVNFENILYEGTYVTKDGSITVNNEINIDTDQVDNIEVSITNEYNKYFTATYSEKKVTITLTASNPPEAFKSLAFIPLVLQGTIKSTSHKTQAVLNLRVIDGTTGDTSYVNFENILYEGTYVTKDGSITVNNEINIDTDQVDNIEVSITNEYNKYFTATYSEKKVTITLTASDPPEAFKSLAFIPLVLQGTIKSTSHKTQAVLNLRVIDDRTGDTSYVNFGNILYEGTYVTKDGSIDISDEIDIITDQVDNIEVSIINEYNKYFTATYSEKKVTITLIASDPPEAFESLAFIPLVLQGTIKSTSHKTQAVLNLKVIDGTTGDTSYVNFENIMYEGTYVTKDGSITVNDEINIDTDQVDNIEVSITNEYNKYFTATYSEKKVTITLTASNPPEAFKSLAFIPLVLQGTIKSTSHKTQAVLNLRVIDGTTGDTSYVNFENIMYEGTYVTKDGSITVNDEINIDTDQVDNIEVSITNEYNKYFTATYSEKKVTITLTASNPPEAFKSLAFIPLVLQGTIKSTSHKTQAVLNLRVIDDRTGDTSYVNFGNILYEGTYVTKDGSIGISDEIDIITDQVDNIEVSIINEYDKYFTATYSEKKVTITLTASDPPEAFKSLAFIPLVLQGTIKSTSHKTQAVLNLKVIDDTTEDTSYVNFENVLYEGTYASNNGSVTVSEEITINTDQVDNIEVSIINEYQNYFTAKYSDKKVTVTLTQPVSQETLKSVTFIPIVLQGSIKSTSHKSQTVLNLRIIGGELSIKSSLYNGIYQVENDKVTISHDQIMVETDQKDDKVDVKIINGYDSDFAVTYSEKEVLVHLLRESPSKILLSQANIPILIQIQIKDTSIEAQAVLNLRVIGDDKIDTKTLSFSKPLYSGNYSINEGEIVGHLEIEEPLLKTNLMNEEIEVSISNEYEYDQYFVISNQNGVVSLKINGDVLPDKIVKQEKFVPLTVNAKIIATGYISSAVLNIRIYYNPSYVSFDEILYEGTYASNNGSITVSEEITINTDQVDNIVVSIANNEYQNYFTAKYSDKKVTVTLTRPVSQETLKWVTFIPIVLEGSIKSTSHKSQAVLNLRIIDTASRDDGIRQASVTGYIVAIVIMSILLLGLMAGSIGFYLWKRKSKSYENMVEDDSGSNKVRFEQRNSKPSINEMKRKGSSALEERRPTGFVYRKFDENGEEIVKDPAIEMMERRKSVAFDDNIEKLQIDSVVDEDIDKALQETERDDHANKETESKLV